MPFDPNSPNVIEGINDDEPQDRRLNPDYVERPSLPIIGIMFFGRDITQIPCFKESFLCGGLGGIGCGLITFMSTSRIGKATNVAVYSFTGIVLIYWINCRLNWSKSKFALKQTQKALQEYNEIKGTKYDSSTNRTDEAQD